MTSRTKSGIAVAIITLMSALANKLIELGLNIDFAYYSVFLSLPTIVGIFLVVKGNTRYLQIAGWGLLLIVVVTALFASFCGSRCY